MLHAEFNAIAQVMIYAGGVVIFVVFFFNDTATTEIYTE